MSAPVHAASAQKSSAKSAPLRSGVLPPLVNEVLRSPGEPLDAATREFMEPRFGHDFSRVRVHTDRRAAESARTVKATAYTVGQNLVFDTGRYSPNAGAGRSLLAHELTHVVQQTGQGSQPNTTSELEASANASAVANGAAAQVRASSQIGIARQPAPGGDNDDDIYKQFIDMPQVEKDRMMSMGPRLHGFAALDDKPKETKPVADVGCHTSPYKTANASAGPATCAPAHHNQDDEAARVTKKFMKDPAAKQSLEMTERAERATLDRLNEAYLHFRQTRKYIHRDEFSPYEIEKDNIITLSERWDAWMNKKGLHPNNLEAVRLGKFDEYYFRSASEFNREMRRRDKEHDDKLETCREEGKGLKWPKLHRTRPEYLDCEEKVDAEYAPRMAAQQDANRIQTHHDLEVAMPVLEEGNPVTAGTFHVAHEYFHLSTEQSANLANLVGGMTVLASGAILGKAPNFGDGGSHMSDNNGRPAAAIHGDPPEAINKAETQPDKPAGKTAAPNYGRSGPLDKTQPLSAFDKTEPGLPPRRDTVQSIPPSGGGGGGGGRGRAPKTIPGNPPPMPRRPPAPRPIIEWFPRQDGTPMGPEEVQEVLEIDPTRVIWSFHKGNNMTEWSQVAKGKGLPPLAYTIGGKVRVDYYRWKAMGLPEPPVVTPHR